MENRLKSYSICLSLPPFLTSISIFSLSLSSFAFFYSHSSSLLSRLSPLSTLSLPVFLFLFSYPSYLFFHSSSHLSLLPTILYLPFHIFPPFPLCPLKIALLLSFYAQFLFHSSSSSSSLFLPTFFFHIFPFFLLHGSLLPFLSCSPTPKMTLQWSYLTGKWHNIVKIRNTSVNRIVANVAMRKSLPSCCYTMEFSRCRMKDSRGNRD